MKKIMFNDKYGLTDAVLEGRKTVTRRLVADKIYGKSTIENNLTRIDEVQRGINSKHIKSHLAPYQVGETVAIAQAYKNCGEFDIYEAPKDTAGWNNKMFVKASLMPYQIEILDVRVERLQDITDEDCIKEGIREHPWEVGLCWCEGLKEDFITPRSAFASLIDKVSKKGTWKSNPYVFRIEFKRVK